MFAVIKTGGKQYKVQQGDVLQVEKISASDDQTVIFEEVLLIEDGKKTWIGTPLVEKAVVRAVVMENFKDKKVIVFKKKRRKQYKKTIGHRQELTRVKIEEIAVGAENGKAAPAKAAAAKPSKPKKAAQPKASKKTAAAGHKEIKPAAVKKPAPEKTGKKVTAPKPKAAKPAAKKSAPVKTAAKKTASAKTATQAKKVKKTEEK